MLKSCKKYVLSFLEKLAPHSLLYLNIFHKTLSRCETLQPKFNDLKQMLIKKNQLFYLLKILFYITHFLKIYKIYHAVKSYSSNTFLRFFCK